MRTIPTLKAHMGRMHERLMALLSDPDWAHEGAETQQWHVVQVMSGKEFAIAEALQALGMGAYVPRKTIKRRVHANLHRKVEVPIYCGYIFARFDPKGELWGSIAWIEGVIRVLQIGGRPVALSEAVMDRLREVEKNPADGQGRPLVGFRAGQVVRIGEGGGAFQGLFAEVREYCHLMVPRVQLEMPIGPMWMDASAVEGV